MENSKLFLILTITALVVFGWTERSFAVVFFEDSSSRGQFYRAPPGWAGRCNNLPSYMNDRASSINTENQCVILYEHGNCQGQSVYVFPGSPSHNNLGAIGMNDQVSSYRQC